MITFSKDENKKNQNGNRSNPRINRLRSGHRNEIDDITNHRLKKIWWFIKSLHLFFKEVNKCLNL